MSIDRQYGEVVFMCDECDEAHETGTRDFNDARHSLKEAGWLTYKDDDTGEWMHICPDCIPRMRP